MTDPNQLSPEQLDQLVRRLAGRRAPAAAGIPVREDKDRSRAPLSAPQRLLWLLAELEPESPAYHIAGEVRLRGPLRPGLLAQGLAEVVRQHEALRTTLVFSGGSGGEPEQRIAPALELPVPVVDLAALGEAGEAEAGRLAAELARVRFDLARGPLLRAALFVLGPGEHRLLLCLHHLVADGESLRVLVSEVARFYTQAAPLPGLPIQYADWAVWHRQRLESGLLDPQLAVWRKRLAGPLTELALPGDRPRPAVRSWHGGRRSRLLAPEIEAGTAELARGGHTRFMVLLAALAALLHRYTGEEDLRIGSPWAGRGRPELDGLIGCFVNTLVLRCDLAGDPSFADLVARLREVVLEAQANADVPFERLVEELQPARTPGENPLFNVMLAPGEGEIDARIPGLEVELLPVDTGAAQFDLTLAFGATSHGPVAALEYSADLFDPATADRMLGCFETLLSAAVEDGRRRLSELPLLSPAERAQAIAGREGLAPAGRLPDLLARSAVRWPEREALADGEERWTYRELLERADGLARRLRGLGVGPESRVGVLAERSAATVAALLGVMRAGAAWVPLDRRPEERFRRLVRDAGVEIVLARDAERIQEGTVRVVSLDDLSGPGPEAGPGPAFEDLEGLAYVLYTSGSTGMPKGVEVPHRALAAHAVAVAEEYGLGEDDRVLQLHALSFDVAAEEIFPTWLAGGCVVLAPATAAEALPDLLDRVRRERVTVLNLPASVWHEWTAELRRSGAALPDCLRLVIAGSEAVATARLADWWAAAGEGVELLNAYGLTETTVTSTVYRAARGLRVPGPSLPIGRPLPGVQAWVVDRRSGEPAPVGVPGELLLGGPGLARGYLGRPDLTAERFVPDPFGAAGERLYWTGDLARRLPAGDLEHLGRADRQVKVRGHRIEPAEIEAALAAHPAVDEAAVIAWRAPGETADRLVAYIAATAGMAPAAGELRSFLASRLPAALIPEIWVPVERLPRTTAGKIDRRALPEPGLAATAGAEAHEAPRTPEEDILAGLWARLLGRDRVGRGESFFDLGGNSLLATSVIAEIRRSLGVEVPLRALFEAPTVAGLAGRVTEARRAGAVPAPPLRPVPRGNGDLPASFAQERLWLLDQLEPGAAHVLPMAVRLEGPLSAAVLARCLAEVVRRHEALRTTFPSRDGRPAQRVAPQFDVELPCLDLRSLAEPERGREAVRLAAEEAGRPFDLARGPLLRARLLRLGEREHTLVLVLHHIVADGWSLGVLLGEIAGLYGAFSAGDPSPLPELAIQYGDFAVWQREWLRGEALAAQLAYWRGRLAGSPALLELPTDRPRPAARSFRGARAEALLPESLAAGLERLARESGSTLFMVLLAGYAALLRAWARQSDLNVGTFVANRTRAEAQPLIGFFVNNLVLRLDLGGAPTFAAALEQAREVTLGAYAHQELPFERLLEELQPERAAGHAPLFQTALVLQNTPAPAFELPGLRLAQVDLPRGRSDFDLALWIEPAGSFGRDGLAAALEHATELFDRATAERLLRQWQILLAAAAAEPGRALDELPLHSPTEQEQVLAAGRGAPAGPWDGGVVRRFRLTAARHPELPALIAADTTWTYGELARRSSLLARGLRRNGVEPIGICLDRSPEMVLAMLAALEAGVAYLPLDPAHPPERLAAALADAGAGRVLTRSRLAGRLPASVRLVLLDEPSEESTEESTEPLPEVEPEDLAYVIYTSGSTGRPKGVAVSHRSLAAFVADAREAYELGPGDRILQFVSPAFDASVEEIFPALTSGATLVLRDEAMIASAETFLRRSADVGLTVLDLPTAFWREVAAAVAAGAPLPSGVRLVILGGEVLSGEVVRAWLARTSGVRVVNTYGPTEATVVATRCELGAADWQEPPIGTPIRGASAHVLNAARQLLPVGAVGELWLGGEGVARGYLGDPRLTAERFGPDPWSPRPGGRLYRTGDLARQLPGGRLEFRGRADQQLKVRGYRVEPAEIAAAVAALASVRDCAVVGRRDGGGPLRLVAYVVPEPGAAPDPGELRAALRGRLPDYMVPAAWVLLERLPLTASGKLDAAALPAPEGRRDSLGYVPPRDATEELLAGIWSELLGLDRVGMEDDFFDLGGHSLLATQVVARVRDAFGVELPLAGLFETPTVAELAEAVRSSAGPALPPVRRAPRDRPLPLSFSQERLWFLARLDPGSTSYHVPRAIRIGGPLQPAALEAAFGALVERHEVLRTTFPEADGGPVQIVHPPVPFHLPVADLSALDPQRREEERRRLVLLQGRRPFDLARGPLLRALLIRLADGDHCMVQCEHHLVHDGWAEGVLVGNLLQLYEACREGRPSPLPALPVQYADFAAWQRQWMQSEVLEAQLAYWREHLRGAPALLELPLDRPRPPLRRDAGDLVTAALPAGLAAALRDLARHERVTLFMAMLAGFDALLYRHTGQPDLVTGSGFANRRLQETEGLLGMIINTVALRVDASGDPSFRELLARVRRTCLGAYAHQDLPFERVVEALRPERSAAYTPVFQAIFAFHDVPEPPLEIPGLRLEAVDSHNRSAKFDLNLLLVPHVGDGSGELVALLEYATALFERTTMLRLLGHLQRLLEAAAADPEIRLSDLPLLDRAESFQLVAEWNDTRPEALAAVPVPLQLAEQARRTPGATALVFGAETLSHGELDRRAGALAARLRAAGVGCESRVGLLVERSLALPVGLLGIWKAGGAYVPLDPAQPDARLAWLAGDALLGQEAAVIVTESSLAERLGALPPGLRAVLVDDELPAFAAEAAETDVAPGDLAYVLYTSGTTGRPKGVLVEHGQLASTLAAARQELGLAASDRLPCVASFTFDIFLFELLAPLLAGGVSELIPLRPALDVPALVEALRPATLFHAVPSLMREVAAQARERGAGGALRRVFVGGEAVPGELLVEMRAAFPQARISIFYGPTEAAIFCATHESAGGEKERTLLGRPIPGAALELRDADGVLVPLGVAGEVWIGGAGVARGYLGRPDLTAERFVPDGGGGRRYRTGDLARRLADGTLEFVGRTDGQVKIRGFRVEPGEVEAALLQHPLVREAAVAATGSGGAARLAAWVATAPDMDGSDLGSDLRDLLRPFLAARLPEYMVPSFFVPVDRLPRTPHGKVDRRALPAPEPPQRGDAGFVAPSTPTEERVAAIWAEVLGLPRVSADDGFFDLGGHSLLATRVVSRLERTFGVEIPLRALFDAPTVAGVARVIEELELAATRDDRLESLLADLEGLSEDEAESLLGAAQPQGGRGVV